MIRFNPFRKSNGAASGTAPAPGPRNDGDGTMPSARLPQIDHIADVAIAEADAGLLTATGLKSLWQAARCP